MLILVLLGAAHVFASLPGLNMSDSFKYSSYGLFLDLSYLPILSRFLSPGYCSFLVVASRIKQVGNTMVQM